MATYYDKIEAMKGAITLPALYEQLAEECTELAQASLKMSRRLRNENPTPKTLEEIEENLSEEIADVDLCLDVLGCFDVLGLDVDCHRKGEKLDRWLSRLGVEA